MSNQAAVQIIAALSLALGASGNCIASDFENLSPASIEGFRKLLWEMGCAGVPVCVREDSRYRGMGYYVYAIG